MSVWIPGDRRRPQIGIKVGQRAMLRSSRISPDTIVNNLVIVVDLSQRYRYQEEALFAGLPSPPSKNLARTHV